MVFEQLANGGCQSYIVGCADTCAAAIIDPELRLLDRYRGIAARDGLRIHYVVDTHTHADHFSGARELGRVLGVPVVMHRDSPAPFADLRLQDGDMLLIVHDYKQRSSTTIGAELADNPRLKKRDRTEFVEMMRNLNLASPTHLTEALRTNMTGGKTVAQFLADAAERTPFMAMDELRSRIDKGDPLIVLDVRERDAFEAGHIPGARHIPRGQLELRVNAELPDPTVRIVAVCEFGKISTLAAATLRELGFLRTAALDGGIKAWRESGFPLEQ